MNALSNKAVALIVIPLSIAFVCGLCSWALSVERRLNVERRVERLEEKLEPLLVEWEVQRRVDAVLGSHSSTSVVVPMPEAEELREEATQAIDDWRQEQRTYSKGGK